MSEMQMRSLANKDSFKLKSLGLLLQLFGVVNETARNKTAIVI